LENAKGRPHVGAIPLVPVWVTCYKIQSENCRADGVRYSREAKIKKKRWHVLGRVRENLTNRSSVLIDGRTSQLPQNVRNGRRHRRGTG